ncbi:Uu.00g144300.m01.CDS01 [Anthostomella pinea]|uniref:Uu.00g144300.m01.CDS01 n=1 Tax=Anthostomella pinea TaxID=933095 RepID=A0AAI8VRM7_9PEZI|nr:Uu.00g144300.m01.CDS01 [Anthostomella pinea]
MNGAKVDAQDEYGRSALHTAALYSQSMTSWLLEAGADVNSKTDRGLTPLFLICQKSNDGQIALDVQRNAKVLISHGADLEAGLFDNAPLLVAALSRYDDGLLELLWDSSADITAVSVYGGSILHHTAMYGGLARFKYIRSHEIVGIDPDASTLGGKVHWTCSEFVSWTICVRWKTGNPHQLGPGTRITTLQEVSVFQTFLSEIRRRNWAVGLFLYSKELFKGDESDIISTDDIDDAWNEIGDDNDGPHIVKYGDGYRNKNSAADHAAATYAVAQACAPIHDKAVNEALATTRESLQGLEQVSTKMDVYKSDLDKVVASDDFKKSSGPASK